MARLLVVDDDAAARTLLRLRLEAQDHEVTEAKDGHSAMLAVNDPRFGFDAVLTDIFMPDMDGFELIKAIQEARPMLPVIALSGGGAQVTVSFLPMAQCLGAAAVLQKPFTRAALTSALDKVLSRRG